MLAAPRPALSGFRPRLHWSPQAGPRHTGFAEAQLPFAAAPMARALGMAARRRRATTRWARAVAQVLDTYIVAATADEGSGAGGPARGA